jgi:hypothetical protein
MRTSSVDVNQNLSRTTTTTNITNNTNNTNNNNIDVNTCDKGTAITLFQMMLSVPMAFYA